MFQPDRPLGRLWRRIMMHGTAFSNSYGKLKVLYAVEDPWNMTSEQEQHRFGETNRQLAALSPRYGSILELGSGEGHQSVFLRKLAERHFGIDISDIAVRRARNRCPGSQFAAAGFEDVARVFASQRFDLICACEVLCYASDLSGVLPALQARTDRLYVSNYKPRSKRMRADFSGDGWRPLEDIVHGDTVWECFLWEAPAVR